MARYIDAELLMQKLSRMIDYCEKDNKVNGLTALFQVGDAIMDCPTADVVPKSEVERLTVELDAMRGAANSYKMHYENLAREIFEEIAREVYSKIPDKILPVTFGEMSRHLDYSDGLNFGSRNAYFDTLKIIAELKNKYTGG